MSLSPLSLPKPTWKEHLTALACLMLTAGVCFQGLVRHPEGLLVGPQNSGFNDVTHPYLAFRSYPREAHQQYGAIPVWNPGGLAGIPWWGNPQSSLFYPLHLLFRWGDPIVLMSWLLVGHHLWGGWGAYFWGRQQGLSLWAGVMTGSAFLAAPYLIANTGEGHYNQICLVAWGPWSFVCFERIRRGSQRSVALLAGVLSLCYFCGHVQELYYLSLIIGALTMVDVFVGSRGGMAISRKTFLARLFGVALMTAGLIAVDLVPTWIYTQQAVRAAGLTASQSSQISLSFEHLKQVLNPLVLGGPSDYRGPGMYYWETLCHFGLLVTPLALWGAWRNGFNYLWGRWLCIGVLAAIFAFGDETPLYTLMHHYVPGVSWFRAPSRILFFVSLIVALFAGAGLDRLTPQKWGRSNGLVTALGLSLCLLSLADLQRHAQAVLRVIPRDNIRHDNPLIDQLSFSTPTERVLVEQDLLSDREAWQAGIQKVQAYDPVPLARWALYMAALVSPRDPSTELTGIEPIDLSRYHKPLLDLLGTRYAIQRGAIDSAPEGWKVATKGEMPREFVLAGRSNSSIAYTVLENQTVMPRAFVVGDVEILEDSNDIEDVIQKLNSLAPRERVLLPQDVLDRGPRCQFGPVRIRHYSLDRIEVDIEIAEPGYLVLTDMWYPGWTAEANGKSLPVLPANYAFRAVPVSPGYRTIVFRYRPPLSKIVVAVTSATMIVFLIWLIVSRNEHSANKDEQSPFRK
ncbi:MAG: YfhO family protein [Planctomycetota bacterium]|nr:YfhO family protein [Planctomycetota bacterium]MDA1212719.1 YfhO family protein [Planctomycetota bacterium]